MERSLALSDSSKAIMASSSKSRGGCSNSYCRNDSEVTRLEWECRGKRVPLCNQCFIAYKRKQFCDIYHKNLESWSSCKYCNKQLHRHCFASQNMYTELTEGSGIKCNDCEPPNAILNSQETLHDVSTHTPTPPASDQQTLVEYNQMADEDYVSDQAVPGTTLPPMALDPDESNSSAKAGAQIHPRHAPKMTDEELNAIVKGSNEEVVPLFEKILSATDTGKNGRLVLPIKCAKEFFPSIDDHESRKNIAFRDFEGNDWHFGYKVWSQHKESKTYVLEDFNDYVRSMKLIVGDIVTFSKLVPGGKLVIGYRKVSSTSNRRKKDMVATSSSKRPKGRKRKLTNVSIGVTKDKGKAPSRVPNVGSKRKRPETCSTSKSGSDHQTTPSSGSEENRTGKHELGITFKVLPFDFDLNNVPADSDDE